MHEVVLKLERRPEDYEEVLGELLTDQWFGGHTRALLEELHYNLRMLTMPKSPGA